MAVKEDWKYNKTDVSSRWNSGSDASKFKPSTHAYAICFTKDGKVLIARELNKPWTLPSVKLTGNENPLEALKKEMKEELFTEIKDIKLLGAVEVDFPNEKLPKFYQLRYFAIINDVKAAKVGTKKIIITKMIDVSELSEYIKWGPVGNEMFLNASEEFDRWNKK